MNLKLGKYSISLNTRQTKGGSNSETAARGTAEQVASSAGGLLPWPPGGMPMVYPSGNFGRENITENLRQIRETVAICMHARSEAIGQGIFHAYGQTGSAQASIVGDGGSTAPRVGQCFQPALHTLLSNDHPLERLLQNPNPIFDMSDLLELSSQWLDATGNSIWLKVRDGNGMVVELWPASVFSFQIERGSNGLPETYRFLPSNAIIPASDVIHIRRPDIRMSPFFGHGIISDIMDTAKAETAVQLFQSRFFENDATPRAVLKWPPGALIGQDEMDRLRISWEAKYSSPANAGRIGILPDGGEVQLLGSTAKELDFSKSKEELRDSIREAFRVPKVFFGDTENVNLANAETSYNVFMRDVVEQSLAKHSRALTRGLASEFDPPERSSATGRFVPKQTLIIEHESVIPESEQDFMTRVTALKQSMTIDEQRNLIGLPPLPNGAGATLAH